MFLLIVSGYASRLLDRAMSMLGFESLGICFFLNILIFLQIYVLDI